MKFSFGDEAQLKEAIDLLESEYEITDRSDLSITVATEGMTRRVAELFIRLRDARLEPTDFAQQLPTLDDVFFKLTSDESRVK